MKRLMSGAARVGGLAIAILSAGPGCESRQTVKPGPPVLTQFTAVFADPLQGPTVVGDWLAADGGAPASIPPLTFFAAVFDRILDGSKLEDYDATSDTTSPRMDVGSVSWSGDAATAVLTSDSYDPSTPSLTFMPKATGAGVIAPCLPSGATVTIKLDKTKITSKKGEPFVGTESFSVDTDPLTPSILVPMGSEPQPPSFELNISFNNVVNRLGKDGWDTGAVAGHVTAKADGKDITSTLAFRAQGDDPATSATGVTVCPPDASLRLCQWPAGAVIQISVDDQVADVYGQKPKAGATAMFSTATPSPDAGSDQ